MFLTNNELFHLIENIFPKTIINIQPFIIFLSGGPGVGKSWIINMFDIFFKNNYVKKIIKIAYMGIIANNIGSKTINSVFVIIIKNLGEFDIPDNPTIQLLNNKLQKMINDLDLNNVILLILDRVSQVTPTILTVINN